MGFLLNPVKSHLITFRGSTPKATFRGYSVRDIARYLSKFAEFNPTHLRVVPPVEFLGYL